MALSQTCGLYLFTLIVPIWSAFPPSLRYPLPIATNKITDVNLTCDSRNVNVTINMEYPFKGVLFAKDFAQECRTIGSMENSISINLATSGCGVRLSSKIDENGLYQLFYSVSLVIQQDRHLRQIADQERLIQCTIKDSEFSVNSKPMLEAIKSDITAVSTNNRVGRTRKLEGWSKEFDDEPIRQQLNHVLSAARAWMEIIPENQDERPFGTLQVGETAILTLKSTLPDGIGWKVVDCKAHDGLGDLSQRLIDEYGCPVDELILPVPTLGPIRPITVMNHQEAVSRFAAFKFPDRDRLHLSCGLQLCKGSCPTIDCTNQNETNENRIGRHLDNEVILDRLEVFNSVEVLSPEIDDIRKSDKLQTNEFSTYPFTNLPGDRAVCVSPEKMAISLCILGLVFLCAVMVAACALMKAKRSGMHVPYYSRSLFASTVSGESAFGSKLLLQESPCMGQPSSRGMHYGRIL